MRLDVKETICAAEPHYIDWEQVDLLVGDKQVLPDEIREIYSDFAMEARHRLNEFRQTYPLMEQAMLSRHAHYLKGAALSLGLVDFSNRLGHLEHLTRTPRESEWHRILSQLERCLKHSFQSLGERFESLLLD